ncbi:MAG TPA: hypothetical protein VGA73_15510 [Candidatus Binatia bacterium]
MEEKEMGKQADQPEQRERHERAHNSDDQGDGRYRDDSPSGGKIAQPVGLLFFPQPAKKTSKFAREIDG